MISTRSSLVFLALALFGLYMAKGGLGLSCYTCTSNQFNCTARGPPSNVYMKTCPYPYDKFCVKGTSNDGRNVIRMCSWTRLTGCNMSMNITSGGRGVFGCYFSCNSNFCNRM